MNNCFSFGTVGYHRDLVAQLVLDEFYILSCFLRQFVVFLYATDIAMPALECLEHRFCFFEDMGGRKVLCYFSVDFISYAYFDFFEI